MQEGRNVQVFFPIDQGEQAKQPRAENLLAQTVFQRIQQIVESTLKRVSQIRNSDQMELDQHRSHDSILLNGPRGTGKSAILVNLDLYLSKNFKDAHDDLLILKPIDPTLLEDGENLFLNMFVAALARNSLVKKKLETADAKSEDFYDKLSKLGAALEASQTLSTKQGTDKIRALVGSNGIADRLHELLISICNLTAKKLIIMPIDDVDMGLQHAHDKIEIVRKYLVSPFVLPIISGDLNLYEQMIWRNFHGRIVSCSKTEKAEALKTAKILTRAYHQKILPLSRRIDVPQFSDYLADQNILLSDEGNGLISLPDIILWIEALLNERVNGVENSFLQVPISSVRELAQLVSHLRPLLRRIGEILERNLDQSSLRFRRLLIMHPEIAKAVADFSSQYNDDRTDQSGDDRTKRQTGIRLELQRHIHAVHDAAPFDLSIAVSWQRRLLEYFIHHPNGGAAFLALDANEHFRNLAKHGHEYRKSAFAAALFQPTKHAEYKQFSQSNEIKASWQSYVEFTLQSDLQKHLPKSSILSYPLPELGGRYSGSRSTTLKALSQKSQLLFDLLTHYNFYSKSKRGTLILTGRLFELLVLSLIRDVTVKDIVELVQSPPFHSAASLAITKTLDIDEDELKIDAEVEDDVPEFQSTGSSRALVADINKWRSTYELVPHVPPHAWFIYNVFNKYFSQAAYFHSEMPVTDDVSYIFQTAETSFRAIWSAFGSFEKSEIFGLDTVIAYENIRNNGKDFKRTLSYKKNIRPFLDEKEASGEEMGPGTDTGAYTFALQYHPIKVLIEDSLAKPHAEEGNASEKISASDMNAILNKTFTELKIRENLNQNSISAMKLKEAEDILTAIFSFMKDNLKLGRVQAQIVFRTAQTTTQPPNTGLSKLRALLLHYNRMAKR